MTASVTAHFDYRLDVDEVVETSLGISDDPTIVHDIDVSTANDRGTLTSSTDTPVTKVASASQVLTGGDVTIDLTALTGPCSTSVDFTGLKVQLAKFCASTANASAVKIQKGASNAYNVLADDNTTADTLEIPPGGCVAIYHNDGSEDVSATKKNVRFTGGTNETLFWILVAG